MRFFEKWNRIANTYLIAFAVFLVLTTVFFATSGFSDVFSFNFTNDLRGTIFTVVCFLIALFSLLLGLSFKKIRQDAIDEIRQLEYRIIQLEKEKG